jgi:hypothetical protein
MSFALARFIFHTGWVFSQAASTTRNYGFLLVTPRKRKYTATAIPVAHKVINVHIFSGTKQREKGLIIIIIFFPY